jgi:hypothetical protein
MPGDPHRPQAQGKFYSLREAQIVVESWRRHRLRAIKHVIK